MAEERKQPPRWLIFAIAIPIFTVVIVVFRIQLGMVWAFLIGAVLTGVIQGVLSIIWSRRK